MRNGDRLDLLPGARVQGKVLFGKTTITFAYDLGLRRILYENSRNFFYIRFSPALPVMLKLDLRKTARKMVFWAF